MAMDHWFKFKGTLDDIYFWDDALIEREILNLYNLSNKIISYKKTPQSMRSLFI